MRTNGSHPHRLSKKLLLRYVFATAVTIGAVATAYFLKIFCCRAAAVYSSSPGHRILSLVLRHRSFGRCHPPRDCGPEILVCSAFPLVADFRYRTGNLPRRVPVGMREYDRAWGSAPSR